MVCSFTQKNIRCLLYLFVHGFHKNTLTTFLAFPELSFGHAYLFKKIPFVHSWLSNLIPLVHAWLAQISYSCIRGLHGYPICAFVAFQTNSIRAFHSWQKMTVNFY